ncbi:hypothetical protein KR51_00026620 [Rubidibacter lacunae KORDI 51-2]|uniref:Uncharacterized protein n=1 Tax=Rubidibacter lacunae KORDI 51-2 TaxID=582515 RepID=U5DIB7_9CHRO|nr:hypothetical protein KR51_00026620 [Rubidibacter lacunae KORDI 51-2]
MQTSIDSKKQYQEPRIVCVGDAVKMTLSFGQSLIRDARWRFPIDPSA